MTDPSPQVRPSVDAREARRRARFAELAMIAPTPEMIRAVLELGFGHEPDGAERSDEVAGVIQPYADAAAAAGR